MRKQINALLLPVILTGCGYNPQTPPTTWLQNNNISLSDSHSYRLCYDFGCNQTRTYRFTDSDLDKIHTLFQPEPQSAEEERDRIAQSIGVLETIVGRTLGTENDQPRNSFPTKLGSPQIDCIAESLNTTQYLMLLQREALLKFHKVGGNVHRGLAHFQAPHNSATVIEISRDHAYAVDSWFGYNGDPAWVVPIQRWLAGESPES